MDNKTVLIAVMAGIVILLTGFVLGASLNPDDNQNETQLSLNNTSMNSTYANDSPDTTTTTTTSSNTKKTTTPTKNTTDDSNDDGNTNTSQT